MFLQRNHLIILFSSTIFYNLAICQGYRKTETQGPKNPDPGSIFDCELDQSINQSSIGMMIDGAGIPQTVISAGVIKGSLMTSRKGRHFQSYRGIRYAESPTGEMRFQPPKPICQYEREVDASQEGPACPTLADEYYYGNFSEDCLRLNVYTPANNSGALLPVIVYIHSGGFYSMSGRSDLHGPHYLMDRDLVLVTINYRLGSLGFLSTGDELAPGNNGMKDQVTALRWVKRNIRAFGGDPDLVTLAGCSAGAISVSLHMISPMTRGLFHRAISVSGSGETGKEPIPHHQRHLAVKQAELLDCPTNTSKAIIDCLKTKTWREIGDSLIDFYEFAYDPTLFWQPLNELDFGQPRYLTTDPLDAIVNKDMVTVPYIITQTQLEFYWKAFTILQNETYLTQMNANWTEIAPISFQLPRIARSEEVVSDLKASFLAGRDLQNDQPSADGLGALYGDSIIGFTVHRLANLMARYSEHPVYYGLFSYVGNHSHYEDPNSNKPIGAVHHDDLIYLFTLRYLWPDIRVDSPYGAFVDVMTALWYHFAKYGDMIPRGDIPELTSLQWPAMTPNDRKYLRLDSNLTVEQNMFENRYDVWDRLYPVRPVSSAATSVATN